MQIDQQLHDRAKERTREMMLGMSGQLSNMTDRDRRDIYRQTYDQNLRELGGNGASRNGLSQEFRRTPARASDMIDDQRHQNERIDQAGELAGDFIDEVDFPQFVKDLLEAVFDANLNVTLSQQESFLNLPQPHAGA